jgi:Methylamine utilisation protein MauE
MELPDQDSAVYLGHSLQVTVGFVFAAAVVPKLTRPSVFAATVAAYKVVPPQPARWLAGVIIGTEAFIAIALVTGWVAAAALHVALALILLFSGVVAWSLWRGRRIACGCFGGPGEEISARSLMRLALLLGATVVLLVLSYAGAGSPVALSSLSGEPTTIIGYLVDVGAMSAAFAAVAMWALSAKQTYAVLVALAQGTVRTRHTTNREVRSA